MVAFLIDLVVVLIAKFVCGVIFIEVPPVYLIAWVFIWIGYFSGMESSRLQGTLGKLAVRIKVADRNGEQLTRPNALRRFLSKILSGTILSMGFLMAGWDERKQALHDKIADTFVIHRRS
jgi:uncharacterized RDD family membrane protein YckC